MLVTTLSGTRRLFMLSLDVCILFSIGVISVITHYSPVALYAGDHLEWHAPSVQVVVGRVHTIEYGSHFLHITFLVTSLSILIYTLSGSRSLCKLSLYVCTLFNICVSLVLSPCSLRSLNMLVTTLSGTPLLCKLSLDVCTVSNNVASSSGYPGRGR
jgi:hypothetical protein